MITKILVYNLPNSNHRHGQQLLKEIKQLGITTVNHVETIKIYRLEGLTLEVADLFARTVLVDPHNQTYAIHSHAQHTATKKIEIAQKPGVMNPEVATLFKAASSLNINELIAADSSWEYQFYGTLSDEQLHLICNKLLINPTIEQIVLHEPASLIIENKPGIISTIPLRNMSEQELNIFAQEHQLYLNAIELKTIQQHFINLNRDPYDAELETIAQTWSEHCCHKTFKAPLIVNGVEKKSLFSRLKETSHKYSTNVVSAFVDNAGAFQFYDGYAILAKVETHNSPSAIEPYGGAATGSGGVFRDIMGTGQGAQVIASTDMFCFAPPDLSADKIPPGCLAPDYLLRKVVMGVRDYGNRMGIPTNNGSVHFHEDFRAKPSVIVGAYGITPEIQCKKGKPQPGDLIFVIGGRTGRDGIHGATFSSGQMTACTINTNATAVQIGNAIEEKRMADAIIEARDNNLIRAITDCGAGGFSSAIGEMGASLGVSIELEKAPLKYAGLDPWEIWVSESQERMICAIAPAHAVRFKEICVEYNVECTHIGVFTNTQKLHVTYFDNTVCDLAMEFLHEGIPLQPLIASYEQHQLADASEFPLPIDWITFYCKVLADWNICSKEPIVRQYDHGVQGTNVLPPFSGVQHQGPNDAVILTPLLTKEYGLIISHGMNPILNRIDPYRGSWWAITEALANLVAVGGDVTQTCLIDNFIWPCPDQYFLGQLDASLQACVDAMDIFKIPFISGKDSLSSSYRYPNGTALHVPPVLCISACGKIPDIQKTVSTDFKHNDSLIVLIGELDVNALGGSVYAHVSGIKEHIRIPELSKKQLPNLFATMYQLIQQNIIRACHDISEGGIAVALAEMCFGGELGAEIDLSFLKTRPDFFLFNETAGCFLIEIDSKDINNYLFEQIPYTILGITTKEQTIKIIDQNNTLLFNAPLTLLQAAWQHPMQEVFCS